MAQCIGELCQFKFDCLVGIAYPPSDCEFDWRSEEMADVMANKILEMSGTCKDDVLEHIREYRSLRAMERIHRLSPKNMYRKLLRIARDYLSNDDFKLSRYNSFDVHYGIYTHQLKLVFEQAVKELEYDKPKVIEF